VHQQQIEVVDPESGEAFVDRFGKVGRAKILVADLVVRKMCWRGRPEARIA